MARERRENKGNYDTKGKARVQRARGAHLKVAEARTVIFENNGS